MTALLIDGANLILDDRVETGSVRIEGGRITGIDVARDGASVLDARGKTLGPAFVDIHGDAFERQIMPRPGVTIPIDVALLETDRQLAANGIATAYHALTLGWEPGLRSVQTGWQVLDALTRLSSRLTVENRLQLRWETFCPEALPLITAALGTQPTPALAFNDHTSAALLHPSVALHDRPFEHLPGFPVTDMTSAAFRAKMDGRAKRAGLQTDAFVALMRSVWDRRAAVPDSVATVARLARAAAAPMLSHDDTQVATRTHYRALGATIAEFPMHDRVFQPARDAGDWIVLGAPNAMRGASHLGSASAAAMIARGLCDILASDYFYPAMLGAVARLHADKVAPLAKLWGLVSANPAAALGLHDRGRIAPGLRADLVLLDWPDQAAPAPLCTFVAGRGGYWALPERAMAARSTADLSLSTQA